MKRKYLLLVIVCLCFFILIESICIGCLLYYNAHHIQVSFVDSSQSSYSVLVHNKVVVDGKDLDIKLPDHYFINEAIINHKRDKIALVLNEIDGIYTKLALVNADGTNFKIIVNEGDATRDAEDLPYKRGQIDTISHAMFTDDDKLLYFYSDSGPVISLIRYNLFYGNADTINIVVNKEDIHHGI